MRKRQQVCTRAELTQESGLNQSTITNIINELINWGLVVETGVIEGKKGRRSIGIRLNNEPFKVVGIRLSRKSITVALYDLGGKEYGSKQVPIRNLEGSDTAFAKMKGLIAEIIEPCKETVKAIGIATPGPLFRSEGRIALMTEFPGWEKINIQDELNQEFGLPVYIEHDAKAGALAHWWFSEPHRDHGVMVYVAAGQGVGAGIVMDGKVYRGTLGMAGEIGHMSIDYNGPLCECGHKGCLELYCSTTALLKKLNQEHSSLPSVWKSVQQDEPATVEAVRSASWFLGFGLVNIINTFNPDRIIIGDELSNAGELVLRTIREVIDSNALPVVSSRVTLELASPAVDDILVGAATTAIDSLLTQPSVLFGQ
ncbi:ROK family transcriptional regulator [Paenibacillus glycanilyticus]|uniref:ROK family transcriptional regulator n=1 Tax=Paenibacillus glycanilyticus TaxID=126569 RepID=UPI001F1D4950|nr:ROK family transcriptional regulator [Paenibacillus glycanilyticus]